MDYTEYRTQDGFRCFEQRGVRCFLIEGEDWALLIDTGFGGALRAQCEAKTDKPIRLLLTHGDRDHTGCVEDFPRPWMHPAELPCFAEKYGREVETSPIREGDVLELGGWRFETVHIPGHTPGSIALLEPERRFLIGGDSVQTGPIYMFGLGRDLAAYRASMEKLDGLRPRFDYAYSSHNELLVPAEVIPELRDFADELLAGRRPEAEPAPAFLPDTVRLYRRGRTAFYMEE